MITEAEIREAARTLASEASSPAEVILFGSHARGQADAGSDVDFFVIEDDVPDQIAEYVRLRNAIRGLESPVDILIISRERAARRGAPGSVIRKAFAEGHVVARR